MKVLIVEDERKMRALLSNFLSNEGYAVHCADNGTEGLRLGQLMEFGVLLIDVMMPGIDGITLIKRLRVLGVTTPAIILSARGALDHRIEGLDAGADDYLPKPFSLSELSAKLRAIKRRSMKATTTFSLDDLTYNQLTRETRRAGVKIDLSTREALLLEILLTSAGQVVSRMEIIKRVWEYDFDPGTNIVEVYVRRLRDKIDRGQNRKLIHNVRGLGYTLRA
jgi:DNA-binding response OmpR family regulator